MIYADIHEQQQKAQPPPPKKRRPFSKLKNMPDLLYAVMFTPEAKSQRGYYRGGMFMTDIQARLQDFNKGGGNNIIMFD